MTIRTTLTLTLEVPVEIQWNWEHDDDGCGSPSSTGNSMTGWRGRYKVAESVGFNGADLAKWMQEQLGAEDVIELAQAEVDGDE